MSAAKSPPQVRTPKDLCLALAAMPNSGGADQRIIRIVEHQTFGFNNSEQTHKTIRASFIARKTGLPVNYIRKRLRVLFHEGVLVRSAAATGTRGADFGINPDPSHWGCYTPKQYLLECPSKDTPEDDPTEEDAPEEGPSEDTLLTSEGHPEAPYRDTQRHPRGTPLIDDALRVIHPCDTPAIDTHTAISMAGSSETHVSSGEDPPDLGSHPPSVASPTVAEGNPNPGTKEGESVTLVGDDPPLGAERLPKEEQGTGVAASSYGEGDTGPHRSLGYAERIRQHEQDFAELWRADAENPSTENILALIDLQAEKFGETISEEEYARERCRQRIANDWGSG